MDRRTSVAIPDQRSFMSSRKGLLLLTGGIALLVVALSRWDSVGPQSLICQHRDDPDGKINFRVDVGRGEDRVRFADGQALPVETSRDQITFLEKESNRFHLADNDSDDESRKLRELGIPATTGSVVMNFDLRHDVDHRTTIERHRLTFEEQSLTKQGRPGAVMMTGRCRLVDGPSAREDDASPSRPLHNQGS